MSDKTLTVVASHRDRLAPDNNSTKLWLKSIQNQTSKDFEVLIVDGGSKNYDELVGFLKPHGIKCIQHLIGHKFQRALLNNVGVRNAKTPYIMTTDVDMCFAPKLFETIMSTLDPENWVQSRTMYWKSKIADAIYRGELDPIKDLESCKIGRIKKRTTAGGCQCGHISAWNKVRGFDERYVGWGSEDVDLLARVRMAKLKVRWLGESRENIMLFHQPHRKISVEEDLADQNVNKQILNSIKSYIVNPNEWGGVIDGITV